MSALKEKEQKGWKWFTTTDMEDPALLSFRQPLTYASYPQTRYRVADVMERRAALYKISEMDKNILSEHRLFCHKFKICPDLRAFWELLIEQCALNILNKR